MNKEEAKKALRRYRPPQVGDDDPELSEALELAKSDEELAAVLILQNAFHARVQSGLRAPHPPANLKGRILESGKQALAQAIEREKVIEFPWKMLAPLAAAALFAVLLSVASFWLGNSPEKFQFADFRTRTARIALRDYNRMDLKSTNSVAIRSYLAEHSPFGDYSVPKGLYTSTPFGCATLRWKNIPAGMVCFKRGTNDLVWLFMIESPSIVGSPSSGKPEFQAVGRFATASWSSGGKSYVLGLIGKEKDVGSYF